MSSIPAGTPGTRSLPAKPSLEFERKRAKALLKRLRADDPNATLADAQFFVARELGFASWPRLVQYFQTLERELQAMPRSSSLEVKHYEANVRSLLAEHRLGREWAGRSLAAFVPRFYGRTIADVLAQPVTEDDARLVVARNNQFPSWEQLVERTTAERATRGDPWTRSNTPAARAGRAIHEHDVDRLASIVDEHPELLQTNEADDKRWGSIMYSALITERIERTPEARRVTDWLVSRGVPIGNALNRLLLGHPNMTEEEVQYLLDRGADPTWVAPNGRSVLEHAIMRYMNGKAVDLIAARTRHGKSLWIAVGLGDVARVQRYFGKDGKLTARAYSERAPFELMPGPIPMLPDPDHTEMLGELAVLAALNGRTKVIELLIAHGFPIDYYGWGGTSLLRFAIGQRDVATVESLIKLGADLDGKGEWPHSSAREFAREIVQSFRDDPRMPRILELCGAGTVEEVVAEADRRRPSPPPVGEGVVQALAIAGDDAARLEEMTIRPEHLFVGLLRSGGLSLEFLAHAGVDFVVLRATYGSRLHAERIDRQTLPLASDAKAIVERAVAIADSRRHGQVRVLHLLEALVEQKPRWITEYGGDLERFYAIAQERSVRRAKRRRA